jgi:hypothetical protein
MAMGDGAQPPLQQPAPDQLELAETLHALNPTGFHPLDVAAWRWAEGVVCESRQLWTRGGGRQGEEEEEDKVKMDKKKNMGKGMKEEGEAAEAPASQPAS